MNKIKAFLDNFRNGDLSDDYFASEMKANGGNLKPEINLQNVCKMSFF